MRRLPPKKLKVLTLLFLGSGILGIVMGLGIIGNEPIFMMTFVGVLNLGLGGFVGWIFLNQEPRSHRKRKK